MSLFFDWFGDVICIWFFSGRRPFGCSLLVAGWNADDGKAELYQVDPSVRLYSSFHRLCYKMSYTSGHLLRMEG